MLRVSGMALVTPNFSCLPSARLQPTCGQISSFTELLPDEKFRSRRDNAADDGGGTAEEAGGGGDRCAAATAGPKRGEDDDGVRTLIVPVHILGVRPGVESH